MEDLYKMQKLIGKITAEDLKQVDCSVGDVLGIFVPSTGFCKYAITPHHTHPSYMFNIFVVSEQQVIEPQISVPDNHFLSCVLSPNVPHSENDSEGFSRYYAVMIEKDYLEKTSERSFNMHSFKNDYSEIAHPKILKYMMDM